MERKDNKFISVSYSPNSMASYSNGKSTTNFTVSYNYKLDPLEGLESLIINNVGVGKI